MVCVFQLKLIEEVWGQGRRHEMCCNAEKGLQTDRQVREGVGGERGMGVWRGRRGGGEGGKWGGQVDRYTNWLTDGATESCADRSRY